MKTINNYQITRWLPKSEKSWLETERDRINSNPARKAIIAENDKRQMALIEDKPVAYDEQDRTLIFFS